MSWTSPAEIRAVFYLFDMDKDGFITKDEVEEVLLSMGVHPSQECISQVFQQVDLDGWSIRFVEG